MDMDMQVFVFRARPTKGSPEYGKVLEAHAEFWVKGTDTDANNFKACEYLLDNAWEIIEPQTFFETNDDHIQQFQKEVIATYRRAKISGFYVLFSALPVKDRTDNIVEIRPISGPGHSSDDSH